MKKTDVAKKMKIDKVAQRAFQMAGFHAQGNPKQKGKASLNPVQKSKDNMVQEGKNEQEKA